MITRASSNIPPLQVWVSYFIGQETLTSVTIPWNNIPTSPNTWTVCDVPDIPLRPGVEYFIGVQTTGLGYYLGYYHIGTSIQNDPYPRGIFWICNDNQSGIPGQKFGWWSNGSYDWFKDYAFKTYGDPVPPLYAEANGPYSGFCNQSIGFKGSASGGFNRSYYQYRWDFTNDGIYDTNWISYEYEYHAYSTPGNYTIKLQVKDELGTTATDTAEVTITTIESQPNIKIDQITGRFGVSAIIRNNGTAAATNLNWSIDVSGGFLLRSGYTHDVISELAVNASKTITSSGLWGIGSITIDVQIGDTHKQAKAFLLGPLVLGVKQQ
jgi:hypothetical protein